MQPLSPFQHLTTKGVVGLTPILPHLRCGVMGFNGQIYETGAPVPETGIYRVVHSTHRLPHEVVILRGQRFPKCQRCAESVLFELVHAAPDLFRHTIDITYELAVIEEADSAEAG